MNTDINLTGAPRGEYLRLLRLGLPVFFTQLGIIIVNFADTMMVGAYGTPELGAAAFVNNFFMVPTVLLIGFASGLTPLIGALFSQKKGFEAGQMFRAGLRLNTAVSATVTILLALFYFLLDHLGQPEELMPLIKQYYVIVLFTLIPVAIFNCCQQMANGVTDTALPMWIVLAANVLNICGNYLLIFGHCGAPELGLAGAGISTLTARIAACAAILLFTSRARRYRPYREGLLAPGGTRATGRRVWQTSYPVMVQSGVECSLWAFGAVVCGWFGTIPLASFQVANTMAQLGFMTYISFGVALSVRVANFMGLNDIDGIRRTTAAGLRIILGLATVASLTFFLIGDFIIALFTPSPEVRACAATLILPMILYQYGDATQLAYVNALRGTSHVRPLLPISVISYLLVGIPLMLLMAKTFALEAIGVYFSFSAALFVAAVLLIRAFRRTLARTAAGLHVPSGK